MDGSKNEKDGVEAEQRPQTGQCSEENRVEFLSIRPSIQYLATCLNPGESDIYIRTDVWTDTNAYVRMNGRVTIINMGWEGLVKGP